MSLSTLTWLLILAFLVLLWWQHTGFFHRARELAKARCIAESIQLLDDSVAFAGFKVCKTSQGWRLMRTYEFEFTSSGKNRYTGKLWLYGQQLFHSELEPYDVDLES